jgi:hypothetical protein
MRHLALSVAALLLSGCAVTNPLGFWDITELTVAIDGADSSSQIDYGTFEVIELSGSEVGYAHVRYYPVVTDNIAEFAPQQTPLESSAQWEEGGEVDGFNGLRLFGFYTGMLEIDRYRGPNMTLVGEGTWSSSLSGVAEGTPVELTLELER